MRYRKHEPGLRPWDRAKPSWLAALLVACALPACGPRDAAYDTSRFQIHDTIAPPDVAVPSNRGAGSSDFDGLYLEGPNAFSCCWIAPRATLLVRKRGPATKLVGGFRVPAIPRFAGGQIVTVRLPDDVPHRIGLRAGQLVMVELPIPRKLRNVTGLIPVQTTTAIDYVPSRDTRPSVSLFSILHLRAAAPSSDTRELGVVLLYLYFR